MSKVDDILRNYSHRSPGVRSKLYSMMQTGKLKGTGKFVILPVDQGMEHGPARSFAPNPKGYDPLYHVELAIEGGCNAYAAPLGFIEAAATEYPGHIPLILKVNNNDSLYSSENPSQAMTASIQDALEMGCHGIGFTIYPGSANKNESMWQLRELIREAHDVGLAAIVWSYPRGEKISKEGETALDVVAYAAHIAAQVGADIIKVKPPTNSIGLEEARASYNNVKMNSLRERIAHVVEATFNNKRIVIFSGGSAKSKEDVLNEIVEIHQGGGYGSIIGRNTFQRPKQEAIQLLDAIMAIYKG